MALLIGDFDELSDIQFHLIPLYVVVLRDGKDPPTFISEIILKIKGENQYPLPFQPDEDVLPTRYIAGMSGSKSRFL